MSFEDSFVLYLVNCGVMTRTGKRTGNLPVHLVKRKNVCYLKRKSYDLNCHLHGDFEWIAIPHPQAVGLKLVRLCFNNWEKQKFLISLSKMDPSSFLGGHEILMLPILKY